MPPIQNGSYLSVPITSSDQIVLPQSGHRHCITLSCGGGSLVCYIAWGRSAVSGQDYPIYVYGGQYRFTREELGGLIDADLHAITGTTATLGITVSYEP